MDRGNSKLFRSDRSLGEDAPHARFTMFCLPPAGGGASTFNGWQALLPPDVNLIAIQLPGREDRLSDPLPRSFTALSEEIASEIETVDCKAYGLLGISMGGLLALDIAHRIARDKRLQHLWAISTPAPQGLDAGRLTMLLQDRQELEEELRRLGGTPAEVFEHSELLDLSLRVYCNDLILLRDSALPRHPLKLSMDILIADDDETVADDEYTDWRKRSTVGCNIHCYSGGHFFFRQHLTDVLGKLSSRIDEITSASSQGRLEG